MLIANFPHALLRDKSIVAPFGGVAVHVEHAKIVGFESGHWVQLLVGVIDVPAVMIHPSRLAAEKVPRGGTGSASVLPFRRRRQSVMSGLIKRVRVFDHAKLETLSKNDFVNLGLVVVIARRSVEGMAEQCRFVP